MEPTLRVGIIGDFNPKNDSHIATTDAIVQAAEALGQGVVMEWVPTRRLEHEGAQILTAHQALWCSPGSPYESMAGALAAIRFAREGNIPFFGT